MTGLAKLIIALTLWHEARGEHKVGIDRVADCITNRTDNNTTPVMVVTKPHQFACWDTIEIIDIPRQESESDKEVWRYCIYVAERIVNNEWKPATDYTHYWQKDMQMKGWMYEVKGQTVIGNHIFGRM